MTRLLLAVAATVLVLAACGGVEHDPNLAAAAARTEDAGSSRIAIRGSDVENNERVEFACDGEADYGRERLEISCTFGGDEWSMISIGSTTYQQADVFGLGFVGSEWVKHDDAERVAMQLSPQRLLNVLREASLETERLGEEDVRGASTVRYRLEIVCDRAEYFACDGETAPAEVWIDDDGLVRRIWIEDGSAEGTIEFYDFGAEVAIEPPASDQIIELDDYLTPRACGVGVGSPLTDVRVLKALRRQGFEVERDEDCAGDVRAALVGSTGGRDKSGIVTCGIYAIARDGAPTATVQRTSKGATIFALQNVLCVLAAVDEPDETAPTRLSKVFEELEQAIRP